MCLRSGAFWSTEAFLYHAFWAAVLTEDLVALLALRAVVESVFETPHVDLVARVLVFVEVVSIGRELHTAPPNWSIAPR